MKPSDYAADWPGLQPYQARLIEHLMTRGTMNHEELRAARESLGLTHDEAAAMLDSDPTTVRKIELPPSAKTSRKPPARVVRLYRAYMNGYRPDDWPERLIRRDEMRAEREEVRTDG